MLLILYFFIFALLCAALYRYIHIVIGSPYIGETGTASTEGQGMIFQFVGDWIARRYNEKRQSDLAEARRRCISQDGTINANGMQLISDYYGNDEAVKDADKYQLLEYALSALPAPLNPYKAMFLCAACSLFWFSLICLIPALLWLDLSAAYWIVSILFFAPTVFSFWAWLDRH
jgi:hypothetical protein